MKFLTPDPKDKLTRGTVFEQVGRLRIEEALCLYESNRFIYGAFYLAGYAVECQLKYLVCRRNELIHLETHVIVSEGTAQCRLYVHDWDLLVTAAGLRNDLRANRRMHAIFSELCDLWGPQIRYQTVPFPLIQGERLYKHLAGLYQFFKESEL